MRTIVKRIAERAVIASGIASAARASKRGDVLILAYHNVLPLGDPIVGDTSLHLPIDAFARQLDALTESHDVVALTDVLSHGTADRRWDRPRVVITFDDAYVGALTVALPELARRGMPATVFVAPGLLGTETWWDRVADPQVGAVPRMLREKLLVERQGEGRSIMQAMLPNAAATAMRDAYRIASDAQVAAADKLPGITIGSHTWSHSNLESLDSARIDEELRASRDWLRAHASSFIPWLSYPYGLFSADVERIATDLGYMGSLMVDGGWLGFEARAPHRIPRFNVPARISIDGFRLRLSGLGAG